MAVLVLIHLLLVTLSVVTSAPYLGSQNSERPSVPFSRWQETTADYKWESNVAENVDQVTSCRAPTGEEMIQEYFNTVLAEYLGEGTTQGRKKFSQSLEVPKTCTEAADCKDKAGTACCWVPGGNYTCVPEVPTTSVSLYVPEKAPNRQAMLESVQSQVRELHLIPHTSMKVLVLPVGQGSCIAMYCPNGDLVMYDCGSDDQKRALKKVEVKNAIMEQVQRATIFISHGDEDHYSYLSAVFDDIKKIDRVIIGGKPNAIRGIKRWIQRIASEGKLFAINRCTKCIGDCNDKLHTVEDMEHCDTSKSEMMSLNDMNICGSPDISFDIIAANVNYRHKNQESIVLKVTTGSRSVLLTGDMEGSAAKAIAKLVPESLQSNIYQISHHGAGRANSCEWLKAIRPSEAFVSHVFNGQFKHPRCDSIQRLISIGSISTQVHNTHPFYCARTSKQGDLDTGNNISHRIFSTYPAEDTICTVLFVVGEHPYTTYTCYSVNSNTIQEYHY